MLRYFYILVCIQLCFCTQYIDNTEDGNLERRLRSKDTLRRKHTRSPKKSRVVQFDVENFMGRPDEDAVGDTSQAYTDTVRENGRVPTNYGDYGSFIESNENNKDINAQAGFSNLDDNDVNNKLIPSKEVNARHFNFHSLAFDDKNDKTQQMHSHDKPMMVSPDKFIGEKDLSNDPEKKCSFKNMKMPFFSCNKPTKKAKRQKKRKLFCFNCHKTSSTTADQFDDSSDIKNDDGNKYNIGSDKREVGHAKVSKRAYEQLCPKCIRELLFSLRKKTTKKVKHGTKLAHHMDTTTMRAKSTILDKPDTLEDNLEGGENQNIIRQKRDVKEEAERERRLKELEEVERKIDNVHVSAPPFMQFPLNTDNK